MKKSFLPLLLAFSGVCMGQCYKEHTSPARISLTGGVAQTMAIDLSFKTKHVLIGGGVGFMYDTSKREKDGISHQRNDTAIFVNLGYVYNDFVFAGRIGNQRMVYVTGVVNGVSQEIPEESKIMAGGFVGYQISPKFGVNLGWDNFNQINLGVSLGL